MILLIGRMTSFETYLGRPLDEHFKGIIFAVFDDEWIDEWSEMTDAIIDKIKTGDGGLPSGMIAKIRKFVKSFD